MTNAPGGSFGGQRGTRSSLADDKGVAVSVGLHLFGNLRATSKSGSAGVPASLQPILVYLCLCDDRTADRRALLDTLLPDEQPDLARRRLNTWVWRLRKLLTPLHGDEPMASNGVSLGWATSVRCTDAEAIQAIDQTHFRVLSTADHDKLTELEAAATLPFGTLADGCRDEWVTVQRESLRLRGLRALGTLVTERRRRNDLERASALCSLLVERDPLREDAHRQLMELQALQGRTGEALRQYRRCTETLQRELGVDPLPATTELAASIERADLAIETVCASDAAGSLALLDAAIVACERAMHLLMDARDHAAVTDSNH